MEQREPNNLLYNYSTNSNLAALGVAIKDLSNKLNPVIEQLETQIKPMKEYINKVVLRFKPLIDSIKSASKNYVKFLGSISSRAKAWVKAFFTKSFFIVSRFESLPKHFTIKRFKLSNFFLVVFSSVISPNAPN